MLERIEQGWMRADPAYTAMAEAMAVAYPGQETRYAGQGELIPLGETPASLYPHAEIPPLGVSEPEARVHAVDRASPRGTGAAVGRGGTVPAQPGGPLNPAARLSALTVYRCGSRQVVCADGVSICRPTRTPV